MKLGVVGLPGAGKTTIFNALTQGNAPTGQSMGGRFELLTAVVDVKDERVDVLSGMFNPKKSTYARITYTDVGGLKKSEKESAISGPLLNHLAGLDGLVHVVRGFESVMYPHPDGAVDALRDLETLDTEFLLNDLTTVEKRIEKLQEGLARGAFRDNKAAAQSELVLFEQLHQDLSSERPLRDLSLNDTQRKSLRGFGLLTLKPQLIIFNIGDDQAKIAYTARWGHTAVTNLRGKLEMELAQLSAEGDDESLELFMAEYGVTELSLDKIIRLSYDLMGLQSFFTVGEDEVRAWALKRGSAAIEAASTVHTDLAKGFIRAETIQFSELVAAGGLSQARSAGKLRQEGKSYPVQDGDVINVKFNI